MTAAPTAGSASIRTIRVELSANPYPIAIGAGSLSQLGALIREQGIRAGTKVLVVSNPVVQGFYGATALTSLEAAGFEAHFPAPPLAEVPPAVEQALARMIVVINWCQRCLGSHNGHMSLRCHVHGEISFVFARVRNAAYMIQVVLLTPAS